MDELINLIQSYIDNHSDLPLIVGEYELISINELLSNYWVEGTCNVKLIRIDTEEDQSHWYNYKFSYTIDKLDVQDAEGEWRELPKSQRMELQVELNKPI